MNCAICKKKRARSSICADCAERNRRAIKAEFGKIGAQVAEAMVHIMQGGTITMILLSKDRESATVQTIPDDEEDEV